QPDPRGGRILPDPNTSAPNGVFIDNAQGLVSRRIPRASPDRIRQGIERAIQTCIRHGLTSIHDAGVSRSQIDLYRRMIDEGDFNLRIYAMIRGGGLETMQRFFDAGPIVGYGDNRLTVRSVKIVIDGALGSRGAALLQPYADDPGNSGLLTTPPETLRRIVRGALQAGFQVCCHAIGDRGNRIVLDIYEEALGSEPRAMDHRFRIEHAQVVALVDIPRFARLGVIPSMQATHATSDMYWAEDRVGPRRIEGAYAWRKFLNEGSRIANGSDFPVEGVNPLWGIYAAVTRQDHRGWPEGGWRPEERMTRTEALRSFTIDAAYAAFEEDIKGSLEPGKLADVVVLSRDIMQIDAREILETEVVRTILGGVTVYER
ncbi:amidohydrolase, partial [Candidatus Sumerlaeota bacterium]|nr:amidohydrolase [Candidatus Sumerlaeota bacterium]